MAKRQGRPLRSRDVVGSTATRKQPSAKRDDAPSATPASGHVRVRATAQGFYNGSRIREGAEFTVDPKAFTKWPRWMERLDNETPAKAARAPKAPPSAPAATGAADVLGADGTK